MLKQFMLKCDHYCIEKLTCSLRDFSMALRGSKLLTESLRWDRGPLANSGLLPGVFGLKSYPRLIVLDEYDGGPEFIIEPLAIPVHIKCMIYCCTHY